MAKTKITARSSRRTDGFTVMEVLIAMGLFAVGFSMAWALLPVATSVQRDTTDTVMVDVVAKSATSYLQARPFKAEELNDPELGLADNTQVQAVLTEDMRTRPGQPPGFIDLVDRGYPSSLFWHERKFYWVPLVRRVSRHANLDSAWTEWQVYVFILRKRAKDGYGDEPGRSDPRWASVDPDRIPGVLRIDGKADNRRFTFNNRLWRQTPPTAGDQIQAGDQVLDSNGNIYNVLESDSGGITVDGIIQADDAPQPPVALWYGQPAAPGQPSPTVMIIPVSKAVEYPSP